MYFKLYIVNQGLLKVRQIRKGFFKTTILPKNEQTNSGFLPNSIIIEWFHLFLEESEDFSDL